MTLINSMPMSLSHRRWVFVKNRFRPGKTLRGRFLSFEYNLNCRENKRGQIWHGVLLPSEKFSPIRGGGPGRFRADFDFDPKCHWAPSDSIRQRSAGYELAKYRKCLETVQSNEAGGPGRFHLQFKMPSPLRVQTHFLDIFLSAFCYFSHDATTNKVILFQS